MTTASGSSERWESLEERESQATGLSPGPPSPLARWLLAGALFTAYLPMQVVIGVPLVVVALMATGQPGETASLEALADSPAVLWITLLVAGAAAALTVVVAAGWGAAWEWVARQRVTAAEWLAWRTPRKFPLWSVPLLTLPMLVLIGVVVVMRFGPVEIGIQMQLFSTPALQAASTLIVTTVVPVAEELIFRGALYNALLPPARAGMTAIRRHALPFVVCSVLFGAVHALAGFVTAGAIVQVMLLSVYLTALRSLSGSVKASIVGHVTWNAAAALALIVVTQTGYGF